IRSRYPALAEGDLLQTRDLETLPALQGRDEARGIEQRGGCAGVEPGKAATELLHEQLAGIEIAAIDVGDLQLAARRRLDLPRDLDDMLVVEIEPGDRLIGFRMRRLFLDRQCTALRVELDDSEAGRVVHRIAEHGCALAASQRVPQIVREGSA